jgi:hypothetical protein
MCAKHFAQNWQVPNIFAHILATTSGSIPVSQGIVSAYDDLVGCRTYHLKVIISDGEAYCAVLHHYWALCPHGRVASLVDDQPTRLTLVTLFTNAPEMEEKPFSLQAFANLSRFLRIEFFQWVSPNYFLQGLRNFADFASRDFARFAKFCGFRES